MDRDIVLRKIIDLPQIYQNRGINSFHELLVETGYFESEVKFNEQEIANVLKVFPEAVDSWIVWSENKRSSEAWYLKREGKEHYVVGYFPENKNYKKIKFSDKYSACAAFIKKEIEVYAI